MYEATLDAIALLNSAFRELVRSNAPMFTMSIVIHAMNVLERDARHMLTGKVR